MRAVDVLTGLLDKRGAERRFCEDMMRELGTEVE